MSHFFDFGEFMVASQPKAASQAMRHAINKFEPVPEVPIHRVHGRVICWWREPIERVKSCYRYFTNLGWPDTDRWVFHHYHDFVDAILGGYVNHHWQSQTQLLSHGRHFLPTELYPLEKLSETWPKVVGFPIFRENASDPRVKVDANYRIDELKMLYAEDLRHYAEAQKACDS